MADDDWDADPDFVNDVSEKDQRWGSKTVPGSGHQASIDMDDLREKVKRANEVNKLKVAPKPSYGYGGKFGVEKDRMDSSAVTWDHKEHIEAHPSQKDYATGFGGKYGVQTDRQDKSAVGWGHQEIVEAHPSQKDYAAGFGGKYGIQSDRQDKSAVGWNHREPVVQHPSQTSRSEEVKGSLGSKKNTWGSMSVEAEPPPESAGKHSSQVKDTVQVAPGSLGALRARFEASADSKDAATSGSQSAAQQRVLEERSRWQAERQQEKANTSAEPQPKSPTNEVTTVPSISKDETPASTESTTVPNEIPVPETVSNEGDQVVPTYTAVAVYDYTAEEQDELTFSVGELITEIEKIDVGWWKGVCRGKIGLFPANYVQEQ